MIQTECGKLYTGITNQLEKRFDAHKEGRGARFFRVAKPCKIVFRESHPDRSSASKRESAIKKMSRQEKILLLTI